VVELVSLELEEEMDEVVVEEVFESNPEDEEFALALERVSAQAGTIASRKQIKPAVDLPIPGLPAQ
jgi:hypothetical protein